MSIVDIVKNVITSWQVIVAAIVVVLYIAIVNNAAKSYRRPKVKKERSNPFKKKKKDSAVPSGSDIEVTSSGDSNEELGLEEA